MTTAQALLIVGTVVLGTITTRFLPFLLFPNAERTPKSVRYLGTVLPCAVMGLLVVYCIKSVRLLSAPYGIPEALSIAAVILLHKWKHNMLLSIAGGTILYMVMIRLLV